MKSTNGQSEVTQSPRKIVAVAVLDQLRWVRRYAPETASAVDEFKTFLAEHKPDMFGGPRRNKRRQPAAA